MRLLWCASAVTNSESGGQSFTNHGATAGMWVLATTLVSISDFKAPAPAGARSLSDFSVDRD